MNLLLKCFLIAFICLFSNGLFAQKKIKTKSGQYFLLYSDNSFVKVNKKGIQILNEDSGEDLSGYTNNLEKDENLLLKATLNDFQSKEITERIELEREYTQLDVLEKQFKRARKQGNEEAIFELDKKISKINRSINTKLSESIAYAKLIKTLVKMKTKGSSDIYYDLNVIKRKANSNFDHNYEIKEIDKRKEAPVGLTDKKEKIETRSDYLCDIVFDGEDEEKGEYRRSTSSQPIFSFTNETMKSYFKEKNFLNAQASMSKIGKFYYMFLDVNLKTNQAFKTYGVIPKNEDLIIKMIDGTVVKGKTLTYINAEILPNNEESVYRAFYKISDKDIKKLSSTEIDQIGIIWSTGYEEYNVYNIDLVKNQLKCLLK